MLGFLIEYNSKNGTAQVETFKSLRDATDERLKRDRLNDDNDVELVSIASLNEYQLRRSHSRYFINSGS